MVHETKILIILLLFYLNSFGQISPGAKNISLSHSTTALSNDAFCLFSNPSGLAQMNWREIGIYYSPSPFGMSELSNIYAVYHEPVIFGSIGAGIMSYGFELFKKNTLALSYAANIGNKLFLGVTAQYHSLKITNYGNTGYITLLIGSMIYLSPELRFGFAVDNVTRNTISEVDNQLPLILRTGISYDILHNLSFNFAYRKDIETTGSVSFGFDYALINQFNLRFGFGNVPAIFSAGVGINYLKFEFDYAVFNHTDLGLTHQFNIMVHFGNEQTRSERIRSYLINYNQK